MFKATKVTKYSKKLIPKVFKIVENGVIHKIINNT